MNSDGCHNFLESLGKETKIGQWSAIFHVMFIEIEFFKTGGGGRQGQTCSVKRNLEKAIS